MCRFGSPPSSTSVSSNNIVTVGPSSLGTEVAKLSLNGREMDDLSDIFSTGSYIHPRMVEFYSFNVYYSIGTVTMASASLSVEKARYCQETLQVNEHD